MQRNTGRTPYFSHLLTYFQSGSSTKQYIDIMNGARTHRNTDLPRFLLAFQHLSTFLLQSSALGAVVLCTSPPGLLFPEWQKLSFYIPYLHISQHALYCAERTTRLLR
jgi:hypothetical protein